MTTEDIIHATCSILSVLVLIVSIPTYVLGYNDNKRDSKECAEFFGDYDKLDGNQELYYKKVNNLCCHFILKNNKITQECIEHE